MTVQLLNPGQVPDATTTVKGIMTKGAAGGAADYTATQTAITTNATAIATNATAIATKVDGANGVNAIVVLTAAAYTALTPKVATTMYVIVG